MLLCRFGPEGLLAAGESLASLRVLFSDPFETPLSQWQFGRKVDLGQGEALRSPVVPGKIVCVGRNYRDHAAELGNPLPSLTSSRACSTRRSISGRGRFRSSRPKATFCATFMCGHSA